MAKIFGDLIQRRIQSNRSNYLSCFSGGRRAAKLPRFLRAFNSVFGTYCTHFNLLTYDFRYLGKKVMMSNNMKALFNSKYITILSCQAKSYKRLVMKNFLNTKWAMIIKRFKTSDLTFEVLLLRSKLLFSFFVSLHMSVLIHDRLTLVLTLHTKLK